MRRSVQYNIFMSTITVQDLQRDLLGVLRRVENGEALLIVRDQQAVAEIKPASALPCQPRPYGLCAGEFTVPGDFDQPLPNHILQDFEGA